MKIAVIAVAIVVLCLVSGGAYAWYTHCGGFNSCKNPVCKYNCS